MAFMDLTNQQLLIFSIKKLILTPVLIITTGQEKVFIFRENNYARAKDLPTHHLDHMILTLKNVNLIVPLFVMLIDQPKQLEKSLTLFVLHFGKEKSSIRVQDLEKGIIYKQLFLIIIALRVYFCPESSNRIIISFPSMGNFEYFSCAHSKQDFNPMILFHKRLLWSIIEPLDLSDCQRYPL